ncbi:Cobalamin (vitamin B12) biosynthesis CbiM protein [Trichormus variabilis ATCC 29413]|uniref:Cobalamin (Vitamin B12) biosynthesis CbiM protein n=2 Tax=Anabaena variabilis TaxID=264691 RepID=Q3MCA9_TRIV2|nr:MULTISPECIES: energy-coupling factor ABC transporter permease [Nostocaceae]ABA21377.1 Cobalamin (vitamin B12) biosynthesis CbiM protein [Trichormus variabilis ATCC 29413]MBC1213623.1 energy-coupling factor ABC transporter permease [Trichormus variabilis ARAD]MBC1254961.1 energy-coupling factor ABC transporter permease [Trichormus variabilis V5]MBC1268248.1 energy-coupling factor ABC transporter permease [Trichormus variabilis FSR]MBC1302081.1 energy-coupling factor ABC transporter permease 
MHIPDGFVSVPVAGATGLVSLAGLLFASGRSQTAFGIRRAPILGLTTAFIFAAQMINFPVAGGTSGHLLGGTLAAIVLGSPWAGSLCIATVLIIQAVLFADGGITALGANILNMAFIGVWVGWMLTQTLQRLFGGSKARLPLAAGIAAAVSVVVAAIACAIELVLSGTASIAVVPAMTGIHILIGIGEGLITGGVLTYLAKARPDLLPGEQQEFRGWLVPVVTIVLVAGALSLLASAWPDGLERVAEDLGFIKLGEEVRISVPTPLADYGIEGLGAIGTSIAGLLGAAVCFAAAFGIAKVVRPKNA